MKDVLVEEKVGNDWPNRGRKFVSCRRQRLCGLWKKEEWWQRRTKLIQWCHCNSRTYSLKDIDYLFLSPWGSKISSFALMHVCGERSRSWKVSLWYVPHKNRKKDWKIIEVWSFPVQPFMPSLVPGLWDNGSRLLSFLWRVLAGSWAVHLRVDLGSCTCACASADLTGSRMPSRRKCRGSL